MLTEESGSGKGYGDDAREDTARRESLPASVTVGFDRGAGRRMRLGGHPGAEPGSASQGDGCGTGSWPANANGKGTYNCHGSGSGDCRRSERQRSRQSLRLATVPAALASAGGTRESSSGEAAANSCQADCHPYPGSPHGHSRFGAAYRNCDLQKGTRRAAKGKASSREAAPHTHHRRAAGYPHLKAPLP